MQGEAGAFIHFTVYYNGTLAKFYKFPGNGQSDTAALVNEATGGIALEKLFKDLFMPFGWDADTGIRYFYFQDGLITGRGEAGKYFNTAVCQRKLEGIGEKVVQYPFYFIMVKTGV